MPLIQNYGLFWERKHVNWGTPGQGNRGHLRGCRRWVRGDPADVRDFRDQAGVYALYDGNDPATQRIVYVGQTAADGQRLFDRLKQHTYDNLWNRWTRFSWFGVFDVGAADESGVIYDKAGKTISGTGSEFVTQLEGLLIALLEPSLNRQGPSWGKHVEAYLQVYEDEPRMEELIASAVEQALSESSGEVSIKPARAARKGRK